MSLVKQLRSSSFQLQCQTTLSLIFFLIGAVGTAVSQEASAPESTFLDSLDVNVVNVEVFVTDKKGNLLFDLTEKDFEILEDGTRMKLTHFQAPERSPSGMAVDPKATIGAASTTGQEPTQHFALFVDNLSIQPGNRSQVLRKLEEFIKSMEDPHSRFMVASYDGHLNIRQPFTTDRDLIVSAVRGLQELSPLGISRYAERGALLRDGLQELRRIQEAERMVEDLNRVRDHGDIARLLNNYGRQIDGYAARVGSQTSTLLFELSHLINALATIPGRKAVVFISEGIPMRPAAEMYHGIQEIFTELQNDLINLGGTEAQDADLDARSGALGAIESRSGRSNSASRSRKRSKKSVKGAPTNEFQQIAALANSSRVSFYTIKPQGNIGGLGAEFSGDISSILTPELKRVRESNLSESLQVLAHNTGGLAVKGGDVGSVIDRAQSDYSTHYSLGYSPEHDGDSQYHRIQVKVKRKGTVLRHREGYVDKPRDAKLADRVSATLLLALDDNPLGLSVSTFPARPAEAKGQWIVPIEVMIPLRDFTLLPQGPVYAGQGKLLVASLDAFGGTAPVQSFDLRIEVPAEELESTRAQKHRARFELQMRQGPQRLAIGFVDPISKSTSFVGSDIDVGQSK